MSKLVVMEPRMARRPVRGFSTLKYRQLLPLLSRAPTIILLCRRSIECPASEKVAGKDEVM